MTREDIEQYYAGLSTNELLEIVDKKFDYTELAVTVALEEINKRKISEEDIKGYKTEQISKAKDIIRKNILYDLSVPQKILFFFIWFPLLTFSWRLNFREGKFVLKLKQANYYSLFGFVFMMLTVLISGIYNLSIMTTLTIWFISFLPAYSFDEYFNRERLIQRLRTLADKREEEDGGEKDQEN